MYFLYVQLLYGPVRACVRFARLYDIIEADFYKHILGCVFIDFSAFFQDLQDWRTSAPLQPKGAEIFEISDR